MTSKLHIISCHHSVCLSLNTRSTRPTHTVGVRVDITRHVKVDDGSDMGNVETTGGNVGGDQHRELLFLEGGDDFCSFWLEQVSL